MSKAAFDLYLDESGSFNDEYVDQSKPTETSLVGGLLVPAGMMTEDYSQQLLPYHVHCCLEYKKYYLDVLETLKKQKARFVIFENKERLKVVNSDITYLNIISEGLVKLFRDLSSENHNNVSVNVFVATRKAMSASSGIITYKQYTDRLEEKILLALGRNHVTGCAYNVEFRDARTFKQLDFADIICNTWLTRKRNKKFTADEQSRIEKIYSGQPVYPVFEDAITSYVNQLMLEGHYGEAIYQICTLQKLIGFTALRNKLIKALDSSAEYEQELWFKHISLLIDKHCRMRQYMEGIRLAENYIKYFLEPMKELEGIKCLDFWRFDTEYYLLTMYDHIGNPVKCQEYHNSCMENIACVNRSWEHIDYYFGFCIRELNVMMGRFQFEEVLEKSRELINVFSEAKDLFGVIKTYNGTEQPLRSELLGKGYGVQVEVMINLLKKKPELFDEAVATSDKAINEFTDHRDLSRQYQWRCLLLACAGKPAEALEWLLKAQVLTEGADPIESFINEAYLMKPGTYDFLLWHYSNIMVLFKEQDDSSGDEMAKALMSHPRFLEDVANEDKKNHPWHLVLWNCGKYARMTGNLSVYKQMHRKAMEIACTNRDNVTMMTFAISISADRLSWCRKTEAKDTPNAEIEFMNVIKQIKHAGTTKEMDQHFMIDPGNLQAMLKSNLDYLKDAYLK